MEERPRAHRNGEDTGLLAESGALTDAVPQVQAGAPRGAGGASLADPGLVAVPAYVQSTYPEAPPPAKAPQQAAVSPSPHGSAASMMAMRLDAAMGLLATHVPGERDLARWAVPTVALTLVVTLGSRAWGGGLAWLWGILVLTVWATRWVVGDNRQRSVDIAAAGYWSVLGLAAAGGMPTICAMGAGFVLSTSARPGHEWLPWPQWHVALMRVSGSTMARATTIRVSLLCAAGVLGLLLISATHLDRSHDVAFALLGLLAWVAFSVSATGPVSDGSRGVGRVGFLLGVWAWGSLIPLHWPLVAVLLCLTAVAALRELAGPVGEERTGA